MHKKMKPPRDQLMEELNLDPSDLSDAGLGLGLPDFSHAALGIPPDLGDLEPALPEVADLDLEPCPTGLKAALKSRGKLVPSPAPAPKPPASVGKAGKRRTTIRMPIALIDAFRARANASGKRSYQRLMVAMLEAEARTWTGDEH